MTEQKASMFDYLIPMMTERPMTRQEIIREQKKRGLTIFVDNVLCILSNRCAIYDVRPGVYKILTQEDLKNYEDKLKMRGNNNGK